MARTPKIVILFIVLVATVLLSLVFLLRTSYNISYPNAQRSSSTYGSFKRSQCSKLPQRKRMRTPIPSPKINTTAVDILTEELELANRTFQSERKMRIDAELKYVKEVMMNEDSPELNYLQNPFICPRHPSKVAIVLPFIAKQIKPLHLNIKTWQKKSLYPCYPTNEYDNKVHLVFIFNQVFNLKVQRQLIKILDVNNQYPFKVQSSSDDQSSYFSYILDPTFQISSCFKSVSFLWLNPLEILPQNLTAQYDYLSFKKNYMFLQAYKQLKSAGFDYFFIMEPDCFPIRPRWAEKIYYESVCLEDFLMKGSAYHTRDTAPLQYGKHINGNALYSLRNPYFNKYIDELIAMGSLNNYDISLWIYYRGYSEIYKHVAWIYNHGNSYDTNVWLPWNYEEMIAKWPDTYLVHGMRERKRWG